MGDLTAIDFVAVAIGALVMVLTLAVRAVVRR